MPSNHKPLEEMMLINEQYLTVRKIGQGGFGVIWKAYDFSLRNFIALKELLKEYNENKFVEMFYKEALIAKNIIHENVVRVQHFWQGNNGAYYISMDYVVGRDLGYLIGKCNQIDKKLPWELAVHVCASILKALDFANRIAKDPISGKPYGIIYRDISPGNIMVSFDGGVKLSDFGIAKTADELGDDRRIITGKYGYMSPEQTRGDTDVDHRTDIFSIGVVLYEMLTGKPLYTGDVKAIKTQVLESKFNPADIVDMSIPDDLIEIVAKALQKDREKRYEKAIEMFRDLRRLLRGKETDELTLELSNYVNDLMTVELAEENELLEEVKALNFPEIKGDPRVVKIHCKDFIVGEGSTAASGDDIVVERPTRERIEVRHRPDEQQDVPSPEPWAAPVPDGKPKAEEKGKTVFEEVGDWLVNKYKIYKRRAKRTGVALFIAMVLFGVVDTYLQITPYGKKLYSRFNPPDVVITTVPSGARVSMRTRDGKKILSGADSETPIELRKIPSKTYVITAEKEGFKPVERIVRIEEQAKGDKREQKIEVYFDFPVVIDSRPEGAEVFIDGNKLKNAPWKGDLTAGEHTVKLAMEGFEALGSTAKEAKEGQCNLDFRRPRDQDIFNGVDQKFWEYSVTSMSGEKVYTITGHLFKRLAIDSSPKNITVHIHNEGKPRGTTPLTIPLRAGEYTLRFLDPEGEYEEASRTVRIDRETSGSLFVSLRKWVTFRLAAKEKSEKTFKMNLKIQGSNGIKVAREISNVKPLRLALPVGTYRVTFDGNREFKPLALPDVNVARVSSVAGEVEFANPVVKIVVKDETTGVLLSDAYVWMQNRLVGKTDRYGVWKSEVSLGPNTVRIIAKGYLEKTVEKNFVSGDENELLVLLATEPSIDAPVSSRTVPGTVPAGDTRKQAEKKVPVMKAIKTKPAKAEIKDEKTGSDKDIRKPEIVNDDIAPAGQTKQNILICSNCGKIYIVGPKKPRFCTNCGKPFK